MFLLDKAHENKSEQVLLISDDVIQTTVLKVDTQNERTVRRPNVSVRRANQLRVPLCLLSYNYNSALPITLKSKQ